MNKQIQISKDLLLLKQDQICSNDIMCRVLAELEKLAIISGYEGEPLLSYYSNSQMNEKKIIEQISFQMNVFQTSFQSFLRSHNNKYEYPGNLPKSTITNMINKWISQVNKTNPDNSIFYLDFLNLLNSNPLSQRCQTVFKDLGKNDEPMNKRQLRKQMNNFTNASGIIGDKLNEVEEEIALNRNYTNKIELHKKSDDNPLYQRFNKNQKLITSYQTKCDQNLLYIMAYLEYITFCFDNSLKVKYQYIFNNNNISQFTVKENLSQKLHEFCDYYLKLEEFDGYEFPPKFSLEIIQKQIENWEKKIQNQEIKSIFCEVLTTLKNPLDEKLN